MFGKNEIKVVNRYKPLYLGEDICISYKKGKLYKHKSIVDTPEFLAILPMNIRKRVLCKMRLTERLFRLEPRVAIEVDKEQYLISFCGAIYFIDFNTGKLICEHNYRQGMNNTLNLCKIKGIEGFDDSIVYGEYWGNTNQEEVAIYSRINSSWSKIFAFSKGKIKHIHGIIPDSYRNCVLILTGDKNDESGIWIAKNNFTQVEPLFLGKQRYRACVAFPMKEGILYATDSPLENNFVALAKSIGNTWHNEVLYNMPGPCIYGVKVDKNFFFATSVEPDSRIQGIKYWFTYRLGEGVKERYSYVIKGNVQQGFKDIIKLKKDSLPMLMFQFGNIQFPNGIMKDELIMYPTATCKYDGKTIMYKMDKN